MTRQSAPKNSAADATTASEELAALEARIDDLSRTTSRPVDVAAELLRLGEQSLEIWVESKGRQPTSALKEGFRILALHRQGAKGDPSFNACRETTRELVYRHNMIAAAEESGDSAAARRELTAAIMVARHLCLFIAGKIAEAGLGEFCCSSKSIRTGGSDATSASQSFNR